MIDYIGMYCLLKVENVTIEAYETCKPVEKCLPLPEPMKKKMPTTDPVNNAY